MEEYSGKQYVMVSQENFEDYLVFLGMGYIPRKAAMNLKGIHCLTCHENDSYTFEFRSVLATSSCTFLPGEKFVETRADGVKVVAQITFEGNAMTHTQVEENGRASQHIREFYPDKLIVTTTAEGFDKTVKRVFHLVI